VNGRQEGALRSPWTGQDVPRWAQRWRKAGDGCVVSTILTVELCGCFNHGRGLWHASAAVLGPDANKRDDERRAFEAARAVLDGVGDPTWALVLWSSEPKRRTAHVRVAVTETEALLIPPGCPVAPADHAEDGVWMPRATAVGAPR
jgi:hypothetical protein